MLKYEINIRLKNNTFSPHESNKSTIISIVAL